MQEQVSGERFRQAAIVARGSRRRLVGRRIDGYGPPRVYSAMANATQRTAKPALPILPRRSGSGRMNSRQGLPSKTGTTVSRDQRFSARPASYHGCDRAWRLHLTGSRQTWPVASMMHTANGNRPSTPPGAQSDPLLCFHTGNQDRERQNLDYQGHSFQEHLANPSFAVCDTRASDAGYSQQSFRQFSCRHLN